MSPIKHIWFDMQGTLIVHTPEFNEAHDGLLHKAYAEAIGKPLTDEVKKEFKDLYEQKSTNSALFASLGLPYEYWQNLFNTLDETKFYKPEAKVFGTLEKLKDILPISIFSNSQLSRILSSLEAIGVDPAWFTHIISADDIREPKPALEGFLLMIEKSQLLPGEVLYVGDRVEGEIVPAHRVGVQTALVWDESEKADYSFRSFEEILDIVKP